MRKKITILLLSIIAMVSLFSGCNPLWGQVTSQSDSSSITETSTVKVGDTITMEEYIPEDTTREWTVKYMYINPYGDIRELSIEDLSFTATMEGTYILRYYVYDRKFKIVDLIDEKVEVSK